MKEIIQREAKRREITGNNTEVVLTSLLEPPKFDGSVTNLHYFEWVEQFKSYLSSANIALEDSGPYWRKALDGRARAIIDKDFDSQVVPKYEDLLHTLRKYFGDSGSILEELLSELRSMGEIDSITSGKYSKILDKSSKALKYIQKLKSLERADPTLIKFSKSVEQVVPVWDKGSW